ncbi:MAG: PAS domain S-box protein [Magnetococcales bacterium]|nr:PAS domain S-box protein [Magnetococcales bacterium]
MWSFVATFGLLLAVFLVTTLWVHREHEAEAISQLQNSAEALFNTLLDENVRSMTALLQAVEREPHFSQLFLSGDRQGLFEKSQGLFTAWRASHGITHLYFTGPDGTNFLRVHQPRKYGDRIDRPTTRAVLESGRPAHGVELGPLGTLTLRVAMPWHPDGRSIGILEAGKEVELLLDLVSQDLRVELLHVVRKSLLNREAWEQGMKMLGRTPEWDRFDNFVWSGSTGGYPPPGLDSLLADGDHRTGTLAIEPSGDFREDHAHYFVIPLKDALGGESALAVGFFQDGRLEFVTRTFLLVILVSTLATAGLLGILFFRSIGQVEKRLQLSSRELLRSEGRVRAILDTAMDAIISIDVEGRILEFNRAAERIFGFARDEILGRDLVDTIVPAELRERHRQGMASFRATGQKRIIDRRLEMPAMHANGTRIATELAITVVPDGETPFFTGYLRDATERRLLMSSLEASFAASQEANRLLQAEVAEHRRTLEQLRASHDRFEAVTRSINDAIIATDANQVITFWNKGAEELFGYDRREALGQTVSILVPECYGSAHLEGFSRFETSGGRLVGKSAELVARRRDGTEFPMEMSLNSWLEKEDRYFSAVIRDTSTRKKREAERDRLLQSQIALTELLKIGTQGLSLDRQLQIALDLILSRTWLTTAEKGAIFLTEASGKALLMAVQKGLSSSILDLCRRVLPGRCLCGRALESQKVVFADSIDERHEIAHDGMIPHGHYCVPIAAGERMLGLINVYLPAGHAENRDEVAFLESMANSLTGIIERARGEEALRHAREAAEQANRAKSEFLAAMSHDIRTPMHAILGMSEVLKESRLNHEQRHDLEVMNRAGETLLALINDILDLSKVESGLLKLEVISFDLTELVRDTHCMLQERAHAHRLAYPLNLLPGLPHRVVGDPQRLRQVLLNLLGNALKFTKTGEVCLTVEKWQGDAVRFSVRDTGIGIPERHLPSIFDPFRQGDATISRRFGGSGLGLSICKRLVQAMGGEIAVESTPEKGSLFRFTARLPNAKGDLQDSESTPADPLVPGGPVTEAAGKATPLSILIADDTEEGRVLIAAFLRGTFHRITAVVNGEEAVRAFQAEAFDLVLMDMQMPVLDGLGATRKIRAWELSEGRPRTPIIALTANAMREDIEKTTDAGCDLHLSKPIRKARLLEAIQQFPPSTAARDKVPSPAART